MYYDWTKIDGYHCKVKIVIAQRGIGKTFWKLWQCARRYVTKREKFIYLVETGDMVKELAKNNGDKFWNKIIEYVSERDTSKKRYFYDKLVGAKLEEVKEDSEGDVVVNEDIFKRGGVKAKLYGSTIVIDDETAGYIVDFNSFADIKRNNFAGVKNIIIDEFISEKTDKTTLEYPKKISSIIQSVSRLKDVNITMLGNSIRVDDPVLSRMGFNLKDYGIYYYRDEHGLFAVLDYVNPADYPEFVEAHSKSVAGRFAKMVGEVHEEENRFMSQIPKSRRIQDLRYRKGGMFISITRDNVVVTLRSLENGGMACVPFCGRRTEMIYCFTEKEQGFRLGVNIVCNKMLKDMIFKLMQANAIWYYSEVEYNQLKLILKGD